GSIINLSSMVGIEGGHPSLLYPTSKTAVIGLTKSMAAHHGTSSASQRDRSRHDLHADGSLEKHDRRPAPGTTIWLIPQDRGVCLGRGDGRRIPGERRRALDHGCGSARRCRHNGREIGATLAAV